MSKKIINWGIIFTCLCLALLPSAVFAKETSDSDVKRVTKCKSITVGSGKTCSPENLVNIKFIQKGDTVVVKTSAPCGGEWKAYIGAPNKKDDIRDYFSALDPNTKKRSMQTGIMDEPTWNDAADRDGKTINLNSKDGSEYIQVFVTPAGTNSITNGKKKYKVLGSAKDIRMDVNDNLLFENPPSAANSCKVMFEKHMIIESPTEVKNSSKNSNSKNRDSNNNDNTNPIYDSEHCIAMRAGKYYIDKDTPCKNDDDVACDVADQYLGDKNNYEDGNYDKKMKRYFPYCYTEEGASINLGNKVIRESRKRFIEYYNGVKKLQKLSNKYPMNNFNSLITEYQNLYGNAQSYNGTNTIINNDIACDKSSLKAETKVFWTQNKMTSSGNSFCEVKCAEKLTTTYSPPIATKAGICFTYKVTVKSKVDCGVSINGDTDGNPFWPKNVFNRDEGSNDDDNGFCKLGATCSGDSTTQAGPNDEFEECINDCDGGKYTEKCSNKCYKKVYETANSKENGNSSSNKLLGYDSKKQSSIKLLADDKLCKEHPAKWNEQNKSPYQSYCYKNPQTGKGTIYDDLDKRCGLFNNIMDGNNLTICAKAFMYAKTKSREDAHGKYDKKSDGKIVWIPDSDVQVTGSWKSLQTKEAPAVGNPSDRTMNTTHRRSVIGSMKRVAPYYLHDIKKAKSTLLSLFAHDNIYLDGRYDGKAYDIDNHGIKWQNRYGWSCKDTCWFINRDNDDSDCVTDSEEAYAKFDNQNNKLNKLKKYINECNKAAKDSCKEETSTFYISTENNTKNNSVSCDKESKEAANSETDMWSSSSSNVCSFYGTNSSGSSANNTTNGDDIFVKLTIDMPNDINDVNNINSNISNSKDKYLSFTDTDSNSNGVNGKCYGVANGTGNQSYGTSHQYKTTITFPGDYINLKTGEIVHNPGTNIKQEKGKFCTGYDSTPVNQSWWNWRNACNRTDTYTGNVKYNIRSKISNFGKFSWSLKTKCFYSLAFSCVDESYNNENNKNKKDKNNSNDSCEEICSNASTDTDTTTIPNNTCKVKNGCQIANSSGAITNNATTKSISCDTCSGENPSSYYEIRNVSLDQHLFPSGKPGFNWTSAARNTFGGKSKVASATGSIEFKYYDIDPAKYAEVVKTQGTKIYETTPEYEFEITPTTAQEIKNLVGIGKINSKNQPPYYGNLSAFPGKYEKGKDGQEPRNMIYYHIPEALENLLKPRGDLHIGQNHS